MICNLIFHVSANESMSPTVARGSASVVPLSAFFKGCEFSTVVVFSTVDDESSLMVPFSGGSS